MVESDVSATADVEEPWLALELDVDLEELLDGGNTLAVTGIDGDPAATLAPEGRVRQPFARARDDACDPGRNALGQTLGEPNVDAARAAKNEIDVGLQHHCPDRDRAEFDDVRQELPLSHEAAG